MPQSTFLPAFAKGPVKRPEPPGRPKIQKVYHDAMEQGRFVEKAVGDAIYTLKEAKKDLEEKVKVCLRDIVLASNGMFPDAIRPAKYVIDAVNFAKEMKEFIDEILGTIAALIKCIQLLQAILKNMLAMLQSMLNSLAALMGEICNWNLPSLPSIPNLFGDLSWGFPGFNLAGVKAVGLPKFDPKFTFPACKIKKPDLNIFQNYPSKITLPDGNVISNQTVPSSEGTFTSPVLGGPPIPSTDGTGTTMPVNTTLGGPLVTPEQVKDPVFRKTFLEPPGPIPFFPIDYTPSNTQGSLPNPAAILNNYQLPPSAYQNNVASQIPGLTDLLPATTGNLGDPLTGEVPAIANNEGVDGATLENFKQKLKDIVTLERVYDTRSPHITAAWIFYLHRSREGRGGLWIPEYQELYTQYMLPSYEYLTTNSIPFNGFDPANVKDAPEAIPFLVMLDSMKDDPKLPTLLWKLSFIEASLLGYFRTKRWDVSKDTSWHGYTSDDLDYTTSQMGSATETIKLDSDGLAVYPSSITIYSGWREQIELAIQAAALDIYQHEEWRTQRAQFRFIYDQFAMATEVDRFSQFWREWSANFTEFVATEDPKVLPFILNYWETINSKVNPLTTTDLYDYLRRDTMARHTNWVPGSNVINIPHAQPLGDDAGWIPNDDQTGWAGDKLDVGAFLSRPDIKALPINTQLAMLSLNQAYAAMSENAAVSQASLTQQLNELKNLTATSLVKGFKVSSTKGFQIKPAEKVTLKFNTTEFDITGNVANTNLFIIQEGGNYHVTGTFIFDKVTTPAIRKVEIWINDTAVFTDVSPNTVDQGVVRVDHKVEFKREDKIQIKVFHTGLDIETLISGFIFECLAVADAAGGGGGGAGGPAGGTSGPFDTAALAGAATDAGSVAEGMPGAGVAAAAAYQAAGVAVSGLDNGVGGSTSTFNSGEGGGGSGSGGSGSGSSGSGSSRPGTPGTGGADGRGQGNQVLTSGGMVPPLPPREQLAQASYSTPSGGAPPPAAASVADTQLVAGSFNWGVIGSGLKQMPAGTSLSSLMAVYTNADGKALPIHPETDTSTVPYFDGVTLNTVEANKTVTVALMYGQEYQTVIQTVMPNQAPPPDGAVPMLGGGNVRRVPVETPPEEIPAPTAGVDALPTGNLQPGKMMFVGPGGFITHDFDFVKANCRWIAAVGRATAKDKFIYEPHIPMDQEGGGGGGPAVGVYTHVQSSPASTWTITHNLGRYVNVEVYDSDGDSVPRDVVFVDLNTVTVRLLVDTAGHAACA